MSVKPKVLFFVAVDWFFCSHFMGRALAAKNAGYEVLVLTQVLEHGDQITQSGLRLIPLELDRRSVNPFSTLKSLSQICRIYRSERPSLVHQVAIKPILLGTLVARLAGIRNIVNAIVGMGYLSTSERRSVRVLRPLLNFALNALLNPVGSRVVFENKDDLRSFVAQGQVRSSDAILIRGAGVAPSQIQHGGGAKGSPLVVLVARLLWDKGIGEYVDAARLLRQRGVKARLAIVGDIDRGNRGCIDPSTIEAWRAEGLVELWGFRTDIAQVLAEATIACLPSYREGLPKSLLEAMAAGLPCVTTDVPGCREAVRHEDNGLLVPAKDSSALADALQRLLLNPDLAKKMGERGRERLEQEFSAQHVNDATLALYREMLEK
jgi:glycosyltransferase involved in cell wall biosynthesis